MAVSVTNNLQLIDAADAITDWTSDGGGLSTYSGFQREGNANLGEQASNGAVNVYHTDTGLPSFAAVTVFGPWIRSGNPTLQSSGGFRTVLGDGTNRAIYYVGGSDNFGFFYNGYSLFRLDTTQLAAYTNETLSGGGDASLALASVQDVGGGWDYGSKAVGNSDNVFLDVIRYIANGAAALSIGGGGVGTEGNFLDIVTLDESTANAWGVIRTAVPGSKSYELNFGIEIGDSGTGNSYFKDSDFQLFISGTDMSAGNMDIDLLANATGTNLFQIDNFVVVNVGAVSNIDLSDPNSDTMEMTNGQFVDIGAMILPVAGGTSRKAENVTWVNCGTVTINTCPITNLTFIGCSDTQCVTTSDLANLSGHDFTRVGTHHAVELTGIGTGSMIWDNTTSGFDAGSSGSPVTPTSTGNEDIYVNVTTASDLTINVADGATIPSIRVSAGFTGSVNVVAGLKTFDFTLNPSITGYEWRIYTVTAVGSLAGAVEIAGEEVATLDNQSISHNYTNQPIAVQILSGPYEEEITYLTLTAADLSITINLTVDNND